MSYRRQEPPPCNLAFANLVRAELHAANLEGAILDHANLTGAYLKRRAISENETNCKSARLTNAKLAGADFREAILVDADLRGATVDSETKFDGADVTGCRIDRYALECLEDYGGLTQGQRMRMRIIDGVATLRAAYSGFWFWVHAAALTAFAFPYLSFLFLRWIDASVLDAATAPTITIWTALGRYILSGGQEWQNGSHLNRGLFGLFCIALLYNLLRLILLWKTKKLEMQEQVSGLPAMFSLVGGWLWVYRAATWGILVYATVVGYHTYHFLQLRIPVNP